jgi:phage baseplate assembly protein gpV
MVANLFQRLVELERKVAEQERRNRNRRRTGVVTEVDLKKGLARVKLSDKPRIYKTGWLPWLEIAAGGTSTHIPPIVGEQVDVVSESGDLTDAVIDFSTHSDKNPRPHDGPEAVIKHGNVRIEIADDKVTVTTPEALIKATNSVTIDTPLLKATKNVKIAGRLHTVGGIYDEGKEGGIFSEKEVGPAGLPIVAPVED